jgi:hypothetical protein
MKSMFFDIKYIISHTTIAISLYKPIKSTNGLKTILAGLNHCSATFLPPQGASLPRIHQLINSDLLTWSD